MKASFVRRKEKAVSPFLDDTVGTLGPAHNVEIFSGRSCEILKKAMIYPSTKWKQSDEFHACYR